MDFPEWLATVTGDTQGDVAARIGMSRRTLQYQLTHGPKIETVIAIADAYDNNPLVALTKLGYVDERWLSELVGDVEGALTSAAEEALAEEVLRRMLSGRGADVFDTPVDDLMEARSKRAGASIRAVVDDDDPTAGIDPKRYAAHPRTENLEEDNPTP